MSSVIGALREAGFAPSNHTGRWVRYEGFGYETVAVDRRYLKFEMWSAGGRGRPAVTLLTTSEAIHMAEQGIL